MKLIGKVATVVLVGVITLSSLVPKTSAAQDSLRLERDAAARKWAPLVWLHPEEEFFPSSVNFFLHHVTPSQGFGVVAQDSPPSQQDLPLGRPSRDFYLVTPHNFDCDHCPLPAFLHGQKPQESYSPPVYAVIHTCPQTPLERTARSTHESNDEEEDDLSTEHRTRLETENKGETIDEQLHTDEDASTNESDGLLNASQAASGQGSSEDNTVNSQDMKRQARRFFHKNERRSLVSSNNENQFSPHDQEYSVTYWTFYPFNEGKGTCTVNLGLLFGRTLKPKVEGVCRGEEIIMGNHVGDWEHVSIQFRGSKPIRMYVSTHTFGAYYLYDSQSHKFVYEGQDVREGLPLSPPYPQTVQLTDSHPVLYSAKGSHGLWGAEGNLQYSSLPLLADETRRGTAWEVWRNLEVIDDREPDTEAPHRRWWRYEGRWGNPSSKCYLLLAGFCENAKGPTGIPRKRINFPC